MESLETLKGKIESAQELGSVVRTMKAIAASGISQYEASVESLKDYLYTIELGMLAYLKNKNAEPFSEEILSDQNNKPVCFIVLGSDQGMVGQFNESIKALMSRHDHQNIKIWAIGERIKDLLIDSGLNIDNFYSVPNSLSAITSLVGDILIKIEQEREYGNINEVHLFHNQPQKGVGYSPVSQRLLPLDHQWRKNMEDKKWPGKSFPQVIGKDEDTLRSLLKEYLFVSVFKACAESLTSENESRLEAMQRAEKNIDEIAVDLNNRYHHLRQSSIDEELFDVVSGFETLKNK